MLRNCALEGPSCLGKLSCSRNMTVLNILPPSFVNVPTPIDMPLKSGDTHTMSGQYVLWPHELFSSIYHMYNDAWTRVITPGTDAITAFWDAMAQNPQMDNDDIRGRADFRTRCIPISIHGDGVPVSGVGKSWVKLLDVWSWSSLLGRGSTMDACFYIFSVFTKLCCTQEGYKTYDHVSWKLRWSLYWLWLGRWPTHDADGVAYVEGTQEYVKAHEVVWLADGFYALLWILKGDLDYMAAFLKFPRVSSTTPCGLCKCTTRMDNLVSECKRCWRQSCKCKHVACPPAPPRQLQRARLFVGVDQIWHIYFEPAVACILKQYALD
jgi:hypothetical protein